MKIKKVLNYIREVLACDNSIISASLGNGGAGTDVLKMKV